MAQQLEHADSVKTAMAAATKVSWLQDCFLFRWCLLTFLGVGANPRSGWVGDGKEGLECRWIFSCPFAGEKCIKSLAHVFFFGPRAMSFLFLRQFRT